MKRLTIDIPAELHAKLKADCAMRGRKMLNMLRLGIIEPISL